MPTRRENSSQVSPGWAFVSERLAADNQAFWDLARGKKTDSIHGWRYARRTCYCVYLYIVHNAYLFLKYGDDNRHSLIRDEIQIPIGSYFLNVTLRIAGSRCGAMRGVRKNPIAFHVHATPSKQKNFHLCVANENCTLIYGGASRRFFKQQSDHVELPCANGSRARYFVDVGSRVVKIH